MTDPKEFFDTYCDFVTKVTSDPSLDIEALKASLDATQDNSEIDVFKNIPSTRVVNGKQMNGKQMNGNLHLDWHYVDITV